MAGTGWSRAPPSLILAAHPWAAPRGFIRYGDTLNQPFATSEIHANYNFTPIYNKVIKWEKMWGMRMEVC